MEIKGTTKITDKNFNEFVSVKGKAAVKIGDHESCAPCRVMDNHMQEIIKLTPGIKWGIAEWDDSKKLCKEKQICSIPAILLYEGGKQVGQVSGFSNVNDFVREIKKGYGVV